MIIAIVSLPVALNVRGVADRQAHANRRNPRPPSIPTSPNNPWYTGGHHTTIRGVRVQATCAVIVALVYVVMYLT